MGRGDAIGVPRPAHATHAPEKSGPTGLGLGMVNGKTSYRKVNGTSLTSSSQVVPGPVAAEALEEMMTPPQTPVGRSPVAGPISGIASGSHGIKPLARPFYGIIVDGIHSHPNSVKLAYTAHPEGCILVTDAMSMLDPHLPDGVHEWRDGKRLVKNGDKLFIEGTDTLAGSVVTMPECIRNLMAFTSTTLGEAIKCATYNPAKCLGIEARKGTLRAGADADLVVMSVQGEVLSTWVGGKMVWSE